LYLASKDLFCNAAAVTAEVEEEEFVCTNPGRPNPKSLLHNTRFLFLLEKAENGAADRAKEVPFKWRVMSCSHHGPNLYIKTLYPRCRLYWCLIEFIYWRYSQSVMLAFSTPLVN
jgi:hypothetical protein